MQFYVIELPKKSGFLMCLKTLWLLCNLTQCRNMKFRHLSEHFKRIATDDLWECSGFEQDNINDDIDR